MKMIRQIVDHFVVVFRRVSTFSLSYNMIFISCLPLRYAMFTLVYISCSASNSRLGSSSQLFFLCLVMPRVCHAKTEIN